MASAARGGTGLCLTAVTILRFAGGALGVVENNLASGYGFDCRCEIAGSEATLRVDRPHLTAVETLDRRGSGSGGPQPSSSASRTRTRASWRPSWRP
jgi:predicted dehydrogenase